MHWNRSARSGGLILFVLAASTLVLGAFACKKQTSGSGGPQVYTAPDWNELEIESLAFCGVGSSAGEEHDRIEAERIVEQQLKGNQERFLILSSKTIASRAKQAEKEDVLEKVLRVWKDDRTVDQFLAKEVCQFAGIDGLIFGDLSDWSEERIDVTQEGVSWSRVGIGLYIYSAKTGLVAWGADRTKREESIRYTPAATSAGGGADQVERRAERANYVTPDPPPVDKIAHAVMEELLSDFPPKR